MSKKPFFIGISGGSCSGKTSIARRLAECLPGRAIVLGLDAYYRDFSGVPAESIEVDVPDAIDQVLLVKQLAALAEGRAIDRPVYDYRTHARTARAERIEPGAFVIIEGLFALYWQDVRDRLGLGVFVAVDHDTALSRRIERDTRERGRTEASVRAQYRTKVRPMYERFVLPTRAFAAMEVNGADPVDASVERILARLRA
jgi:uridine kinase